MHRKFHRKKANSVGTGVKTKLFSIEGRQKPQRTNRKTHYGQTTKILRTRTGKGRRVVG